MKKKKKPLIAAAAAAVLLIVLAILCAGYMKQKNLLMKISDAYSEDIQATISKYDGKKITFLAEVTSVDLTEKALTVNMRGHSKNPAKNTAIGVITICRCASEQASGKITNLSKGSNVKITGTAHLTSNSGVLTVTVDADRIS